MREAALSAASGFAVNSVRETMLYFSFHETTHVGQAAIVAEVLGKRSTYLNS